MHAYIHLWCTLFQEVFYTYTFDEISECTPGMKNLTLIVGRSEQSPGYLFHTPEAEQIVQLISDYRDLLTRRTRRKTLREMTQVAVDYHEEEEEEEELPGRAANGRTSR